MIIFTAPRIEIESGINFWCLIYVKAETHEIWEFSPGGPRRIRGFKMTNLIDDIVKNYSSDRDRKFCESSEYDLLDSHEIECFQMIDYEK